MFHHHRQKLSQINRFIKTKVEAMCINRRDECRITSSRYQEHQQIDYISRVDKRHGFILIVDHQVGFLFLNPFDLSPYAVSAVFWAYHVSQSKTDKWYSSLTTHLSQVFFTPQFTMSVILISLQLLALFTTYGSNGRVLLNAISSILNANIVNRIRRDQYVKLTDFSQCLMDALTYR